MRHPHWHGATVTDRLWYVVGFFYGVAISLGFLLLFDIQAMQRWWERVWHREPRLAGLLVVKSQELQRQQPG